MNAEQYLAMGNLIALANALKGEIIALQVHLEGGSPAGKGPAPAVQRHLEEAVGRLCYVISSLVRAKRMSKKPRDEAIE